MQRISYQEWQAGKADREASVARIDAFLGRPYRRTRPRDPLKAALLCAAGCPEALIGPTETSPDGASAEPSTRA